MGKGAMAAASVQVLQYLSVCGLSTKKEIATAVPTLGASTVSNLVNMGHIQANHEQRDAVRYAITPRGRDKLASVTVLHRDGGVVPPAPRYRPRRGGPVRGPSAHVTGYDCRRELTVCLRPGAMDAFQLPSRYGDRLHWPDGTVTNADGGAA